MKLDNVAELQKVLEKTDLECDIGRGIDGGYILVYDPKKIVFNATGLDDDELDLTTQFLTTLIGGGLL